MYKCPKNGLTKKKGAERKKKQLAIPVIKVRWSSPTQRGKENVTEQQQGRTTITLSLNSPILSKEKCNKIFGRSHKKIINFCLDTQFSIQFAHTHTHTHSCNILKTLHT